VQKKVFITHEIPGEKVNELGQACELNVWMGPGLIDRKILAEELCGCHGLVMLLTEGLDETLVSALPELKFVSSMSVGVDHIDVEALTKRGIPLGHTPGVLVDTTADLTFALLLAAARRVVEADQFVRQGRWLPEASWSPNFFTGKDVSGATLGVIGLGAIGQAVARRAAGFGMQVLGWSRSGREVEGVQSVSREELLLRSDFVSIHVAKTPETLNLVDETAIRTMKPGAVLVNTARGGIVDERALAAALSDGHLYAAGIDVFQQEPTPLDNPLLGLPNVVALPHIGSATLLTRARMADLAVDNALAALSDRPMPHCYNPEVYL